MAVMTPSIGRGLGATVAVVAVLATASALTMPVPERASPPARIALWLLLLSAHAAAYWFGQRLRQRVRVEGYLLAQGALLFAIAVSKPPIPMTVALFAAATAEAVLLAGERWGAIRITLGSIAMFVVASLITSSLYFATTAGLVLALTGLVAHALGGFLKPRLSAGASVEAMPSRTEATPAMAHANGSVNGASTNGAAALSTREAEVLRELVRGSRNNDIAQTLGITERSVKAHLKSVYRKLGVESRSGAVARALQDKLI